MKKAQVKALHKLAAMLPESFELQRSYDTVPVYELSKEEIESIDFDIKGVDAKVRRAKINVVPINHKNRLQKAFARSKEDGIRDYIKWVDANNKKLNTLLSNTKLDQVSDDLMEVTKNTIGFWSALIKFLFGFYHVFINKNQKTKAA